MLPFPSPPLFAGVDDVIGIVFVLVAFIGWIVNLISGKGQAQGGKPRPPARPRDEKLQKEIDIFLEEVGGQKNKPAPQRPAAQPSRPAPAGAAKAKRKKLPTAVSVETAPQPAKRRVPGSDMATRAAPVSKDLGSGVRAHLAEHMESHKLGEGVAQHLKHRVSESVAEHLGSFSVAPTAGQVSADAAVARAHEVVKLLKSHATVKQAILLNTILQPPPGRRRTPVG